MYTLFILFLISLAGIVVMIGRKLEYVRNGEIHHREDMPVEAPHFGELKTHFKQTLKNAGHAGLVLTLRAYVKSTNFLKNKYENIKESLERLQKRNQHLVTEISKEKKEANKFLKMMGDFKHKVREIKHKIKEEEEKNS